MALGTNHFSATSLAQYIPEVWGMTINDFFRPKLKFASFFTNRSDELSEGGDILHTPNLSEMTANAKAAGTQVTLGLLGVTLTVRLIQAIMVMYEVVKRKCPVCYMQ